MASASSSAPFLGVRDQEAPKQIKQQHQQHQSASSTTTTSSTAPSTAAAPQKKKRNLPGTPNPDAEVVALSPRTLLATNRFICEVCNKGFQREQNLQLHRRGHNLPWKLKQKTTNEVVRKKVYLCPEPTCVHHDPSRPLGDLTGIKKHYFRKHGEKKWKCDKCSKKYAVQSDCKAHSKICGTREYRCDCGTLFSRRDSFITHRAFCDALAQDQTSRLPTGLNTIGAHLLSSGNNMALVLSHVGTQMPTPSADLLRLSGANATGQFDHLLSQASINMPPTTSQVPSLFPQNQDGFQPYHGSFMQENKPFHGLMQLPDLLSNTATSNAAANLFNLGFFSNSDNNTNGIGMNSSISSTNAHLMSSSGLILHHDHPFNNMMTGSFYGSSVTSDTVSPQMSSATTLLQKAAQMSATASINGTSLFRGFGNSSLPTGARQLEVPIDLSTSNFRDSGGFGDGGGGAGGEISMKLQMENDAHLQDLMNSLATNSPGILVTNAGSSSQVRGTGLSGFNFGRDPSMKLHQNNLTVNIGGSDGLTRDFLGVGGVVSKMGEGLQQSDNHQHCMGNIGSYEPEIK